MTRCVVPDANTGRLYEASASCISSPSLVPRTRRETTIAARGCPSVTSWRCLTRSTTSEVPHMSYGLGYTGIRITSAALIAATVKLWACGAPSIIVQRGPVKVDHIDELAITGGVPVAG